PCCCCCLLQLLMSSKTVQTNLYAELDDLRGYRPLVGIISFERPDSTDSVQLHLTIFDKLLEYHAKLEKDNELPKADLKLSCANAAQLADIMPSFQLQYIMRSHADTRAFKTSITLDHFTDLGISPDKFDYTYADISLNFTLNALKYTAESKLQLINQAP
ncbi:MAG: hypothetical protein MHMPM18_002526, partial [Marteilia pararefringens]